jgi:hypothetical protein
MASVTWDRPNCWNHLWQIFHFLISRIVSQLTTQFFFYTLTILIRQYKVLLTSRLEIHWWVGPS